MKAIIYCRVSTDDQEREGTSLQTQMEACLSYCREKKYEVSYRFSEAYSGLTLSRPKMNELRELVRTGVIDVVVIFCLDRLSRDPTDGVIITQELEKQGVILEAVTETVESTELGKLISYIRGFASKLEVEKIKERTMRGKMACLKDGKLPQGTGIGIYGYKWDKPAGRRVIVEHEAKVVQKIYNMAVSGISTNQIAISLNKANIKTKSGSLWYPLTVRRILFNQTYTGKTYFGQTKRISKTKIQVQPRENWILLPDVTPPIITDEIFNLAREAMNKAKESRPIKPKGSYLLTGFMRCKKCNSTIGGTTLSGKYRYYQCRGAKPTATRDKICDAGYIKADEIEELAWNYVHEIITKPTRVLRVLDEIEKAGKDNILPNIESKINRIKKSLKFYPVRIRECHKLLGNEDLIQDYILDAINTLKTKQAKDEVELKELEKSYDRFKQCQDLKIKFNSCRRLMRKSCSKNLSLEEKREILKLFQTEIMAIPGEYFLKVLTNAEVTTGVNKLLQSSAKGQNLVTIEQTSACLISCTYDWPSGKDSIDIIPLEMAR